jgi:glycosyltransferase involved in cell wall biosynthesis
VLWRSYSHALDSRSSLFAPWKRWAVRRYRAAEERAWSRFDAVVAINREEERLVRKLVDERVQVFHAGMGADLERWPYSPAPATPPRLAYYGSLATVQSRQIALRCATAIMPEIWRERPDAELWLVGNNPPDFLRRLESDRRIHVTGFVEEVQAVLRTMTAVLCPWTGQFGFRSRLIEVMGLGVPVVATPDAVDGMELIPGKGLLLGKTDRELAAEALRLLHDPGFAREQGVLGRRQVERGFSIDKTYGCLIADLHDWLRNRVAPTPSSRAAIQPLRGQAQEIA